MTNPTPYRHKTTGTIAWIGKPYENWGSIAKVLDALGIEAQFVSYICRRGWENDDLACLHCTDFPITITALPEDEWEPVEVPFIEIPSPHPKSWNPKDKEQNQ